MSDLNIELLTEDEVFMLENLLTSGAHGLLKKVVKNNKEMIGSLLANEDDEKKIYRYQGQLRGLNFIDSLPIFIKTAKDRFEQRRKQEENDKRIEARRGNPRT